MIFVEIFSIIIAVRWLHAKQCMEHERPPILHPLIFKKKKIRKKEQMDWNWPIIDLPTSVKVTLIQLRFICFCFGCFFSLFYNGLSGRSTNSTSSSTTSAENCKRHFHVFQYDWLVFFLIFFFEIIFFILFTGIW